MPFFAPLKLSQIHTEVICNQAVLNQPENKFTFTLLHKYTHPCIFTYAHIPSNGITTNNELDKWEEHCEAILVLWCVILSCGWLYSSQRSTKSLASLQPAATKAAEVELHQCLKKDLPELGSLPTLCAELNARFLKTVLKTTIAPTKWLTQMNTSELPCILLQFSTNIFSQWTTGNVKLYMNIRRAYFKR